MAEIKRTNFLGKLGNKGKVSNMPAKKGGKLTKDGLVYRNDLLDADFTDQRATRRKLKGV